MALNNNQVYSIVREAYAQALGSDAVDTIDLTDFVDTGNDGNNLITDKEQFTGALISTVAKNWFTDSSYRSQYTDPFFEDSREYGAIIQMIQATAPQVQESHAWQTFVSGTSQLGQYTLYMPIVSTQFYGKTGSWELPIAVTYEQWDDAFKSADALGDFVAYIMMIVDNAIVCHLEEMNALNRNNFIGEKIAYAGSVGATGVHVINLVELYQEETGSTIATATAFLKDADAMRWASGKISLYSKYMGKMSTLFNTAGKPRFVPTDRLVVQVLTYFDKALNTFALSDTYHDELVALPRFESVPYWQGFGGTDFSDVSAIDVKTADGDTVTKSGIVAFLCDKWAIMHTIRSHRVAVKNFDPEAVTQYFYQFRDSYANNLTMPALVFTVEDHAVV